MVVGRIHPPHIREEDMLIELEGSGFFGDFGRSIKHGAKKAAHHAAHIAGDRNARHNAGAVLSAASPVLGPEAALGGAVLMASGKGKKAGRQAKNLAKKVTSKEATRKAADIAGILAQAFGSEETKRNVATAQQLERALQGEGLRLAGTGEVKPAVMPSGALGKTKLMKAVNKAQKRAN